MPAFDSLQRASFDGIEFPVESIEIDGGLRDHVHEYPHEAGGAPEKLGRRLYSFVLRAKFLATFRTYGFTKLWPTGWNRLRNKFEAATSASLVVPTLGTVPAYAVSWKEVATSKIRSGVMVDLTFREDVDAIFVNGLLSINDASLRQSAKQLASVRNDFAATRDGHVLLSPAPPGVAQDLNPERTNVLSLLDRIDEAANDVLTVRDQLELANTVANAKVLRLMSLCEQLDVTKTLRDPRNMPLADALHDVWSAADDRRRDVAHRQASLTTYTTPIPRMTITDVATAVYRDASKSILVLQLNDLQDPYNIPKGTTLRMYRPDALAA